MPPFFQPILPPLPSSLTFASKTILVTGGNTGLGFSASRHFLLHHASTLILAVRSLPKGEAAKNQLLLDPKVKAANPNARIRVMHLDLEQYESVIEFANAFKAEFETLDIAVLNAALGGISWNVVGKRKHEKVVQVNILSNALLALELLPLLVETSRMKVVASRLSWVGSFTQMDHSLKKNPIGAEESVLEYFDDKSKYNAISRYPDSKLLASMFLTELASRVDWDKVIINDVSPGMVATNFGNNYPFVVRLLTKVAMKLRAVPAHEGAKTYLYATAVAGEESHGKYLSDNAITP